jgi:hypothetical protein
MECLILVLSKNDRRSMIDRIMIDRSKNKIR